MYIPSSGPTLKHPTGIRFYAMNPLLAASLYLGGVMAMSIITFAAYGWDKRRAKTDGRRIPEQTLHLLAFLGGWPGAILGQRTFRHKTQKLSFRVVFWIVTLLHIAMVCAACYFLPARFNTAMLIDRTPRAMLGSGMGA